MPFGPFSGWLHDPQSTVALLLNMNCGTTTVEITCSNLFHPSYNADAFPPAIGDVWSQVADSDVQILVTVCI